MGVTMMESFVTFVSNNLIKHKYPHIMDMKDAASAALNVRA